MRVAVFGLGYVGTVSAACLADLGHEVVGVDVQEAKVAAVAAGESPVEEPGLRDLIRRMVAAGRLSATTSAADALRGAQVSLVCVGTPSRGNGSLDLRYVEAVARDIGGLLAPEAGIAAPGHVATFRSTMLPDAVRHDLPRIVGEAAGAPPGSGYSIAFCPEFLREGTAVADFRSPPFTVLGVTDDAAEAVLRELFAGVPGEVHVVAPGTAAAVKYASNAFHAIKVTFANEMGRWCRATGVDAREVMSLFVADTQLNVSPRYLRPGFAFGGSCLPKDLRALVHRARSVDADLPMLESVMASNDRHVDDGVRMILNSGARSVALLGLAFKPGTDDLRESPFVRVAETLVGKGLDLRIYDPVVHPARLIGTNLQYATDHLPHLVRLLTPDLDTAVAGVDCVVVANPRIEGLAEVLAWTTVPVVDLSGELVAAPPAGGLLESLVGPAAEGGRPGSS